jgi:drug/metabolite transporter (DMT)-like permease
MTRLRADLLILLAAALWGVSFYFQKTAMATIGPFLFVACRTFIAGLALMPLALVEARRAARPLSPRVSWLAAAAGIAFFAGAATQQAGLITATVVNTGFLTALYVVVTPLLAWAFLKRRPNAVVWPAVALSFLGVWLLGGGGLAAFTIGDMLVALSAFAWSIRLLITSTAAEHDRPVAFTAIAFAVVAALAIGPALAFETIDVAALQAALPAILYVGVLSGAVTFTLMAIAMKHTPPGEASVLLSVETLFAAAAGVVLLGERLPPIRWLGAGLMFAAVLLIQAGPLFGRFRPNAAP